MHARTRTLHGRLSSRVCVGVVRARRPVYALSVRLLLRSVIAATLASTVMLAPPLVRAAAAECRLDAPGEPCRSPWLDQGASISALDPSKPAPAVSTGADAEAGAAVAEAEPEDHRVRSLLIVGGLYAGFMTWAQFAWYRGKVDHGFQVGEDGYFGPNTYAGGADKLGHAWANMALGRASSRVFRSQGWGKTGSAIVGSASAWTLFAFVEVKDGYVYNFSPGDMVFNTAGALMGTLQDLSPRFDELVDFRVAYAPSDEYLGLWRGEYYGSKKGNSLNIAEDYSGQTYYLALHLGALPKVKDAPQPLATALTYLDVGVAFETRKYKPDARPGSVATQELFLGVTLDLQRMSDRALRRQRIPRKVMHGVLEVFSPPYTIVPVVSQSRAADGPPPQQD